MIQLLNYQRNWVNCKSRQAVYLKSRQVGISWSEALWTTRKRLTDTSHHIYVANDEKGSRRFIRDCAYWLNLLGVAAEIGTEVIKMPNGAMIMAFSSNPRAIRGYGKSDITLDEFGFHEDADRALAAAQPIMLRGGQIRIISTHNGFTRFNSIVDGSKKGTNGFKLYETSIYQAVDDGLVEQIVAENKDSELYPLLIKGTPIRKLWLDRIKSECLSSFIWQQEYECKVNADSQIIITPEAYDLVAKVQGVPTLNPKKQYNPLYIGIDIGIHDFTIVCILEEIDETHYRIVGVLEMQGIKTTEQYSRIRTMLNHDCIEKIIIDQGSIGYGIADELKELYGNIVEPIGITSAKKMECCELVRKYVETQRVELPIDDAWKADLCSVQIKYSDKGNPTYDGRSDVGGNSHGDRMMALGLALLAAEKKSKVCLI